MIKNLDHLVLTVQSIERSVKFYTEVLGADAQQFGAAGRWAVHFGTQKINFHELGNEITPNAKEAIAGSADLCFISDWSIDDIINHLKKHNVTIEQGPVARIGAIGSIISVYFRDLDGNLIEVGITKNRYTSDLSIS